MVPSLIRARKEENVRETRVWVGRDGQLRAVIRDRKTGALKSVPATADKTKLRADIRKALAELDAVRAAPQGT